MGATTRRRGLANRDHRLDPIHLCPGGYVLEIEIGAEAQRVECYFHRHFESGETCKINQRDVLAGRRIGLALRIGKTVSNRLNETWPFVQAQERADEPTEPGA